VPVADGEARARGPGGEPGRATGYPVMTATTVLPGANVLRAAWA
jgi:hypothetical protein